MYELEILVFFVSLFFSLKFLIKWYRLAFAVWPPQRYRPVRAVFGLLPVAALAIVVYTLKVLASFDVVGAFEYIMLYIFLGFAWVSFGMMLVAFCFDISWIDDALNLNNRAALAAVAGGYLGLTVIYSGANIGDGPGWWCVIFAGGLGLIAWALLGRIANLCTGVFERITVGRDMGCGIRFGCYLLAGGIILGRASAGDWTSAYRTVVEFLDGWPVLLLAALFIVVERVYIRFSSREDVPGSRVFSSVLWGLLYLIFAVVCVALLPELRENPFYMA